MRRLFEEDTKRFERFSVAFGKLPNQILLDFSKNIINEETMKLLFDLAKEADVQGWAKKVVEPRWS